MKRAEILKKRDTILEDSLFHLVDSIFVEHLIFRGGGALHFIYSSPRYSSDLDFVDPRLKNGIKNGYIKELQDLGEKYPINRKVKVMNSGLGVRARWGYEEGEPFAKIEIEARDAGEYKKTKGKFYPLLVKTPLDLYTDKIFANISRYDERRWKFTNGDSDFPFKPHDLFDLKYLVDFLDVEPVKRERIIEKAENHNQPEIVNNENIDLMIDLICDEKYHDLFRECLRKTMMPDVYDHFKFDSNYFKDVAGYYALYLE